MQENQTLKAKPPKTIGDMVYVGIIKDTEKDPIHYYKNENRCWHMISQSQLDKIRKYEESKEYKELERKRWYGK